jgi:asparagine N-glycosylation enzyme membrane subunit Stt3
MTPHGVDITDSTYIWGLANSISNFGYAEWILHPLSFFGLYPLSYPSAVPTILSIVSQASGLDIEYVILLFGFVLGILGMFGAYIMALEIRKDRLFAFLTAFAFSLTPVFIEYTRWTATARNLFIALLPLLIWSLLCYHNKNQSKWKYLLLALILLLILGSTHRLFLLMPLVIGAYFVTIGIQFINNQINLDNFLLKHKLTERKVFLGTIMLFAFAFLIQFSNLSFYRDIWYDYQTGAFFEGQSPLLLILNMSTNYMGHIGILILFGLVGLLFLLRKRNKDFGELFVLVALLFLTSISALGLYVSLFILPFASVLIAIGLLESIRIVERSVTTNKLKDKAVTITIKNNYNRNAKTKAIVFSIITISLIFSTCFSIYMINRHMRLPIGETGDTTWMNDGTYNTGLFLKKGGENKPFLSNDGIIAGRIHAVSGVPSFSGGIYGLINGFINKEELETRSIKLAEISPNTDYFYLLVTRPNIDQDVWRVYAYDCDDSRSKQIAYKYDINYVVMNNNILEKKVGTESKFMTSIYKKETKVYDNKEESVWELEK